MSSIPQSLLRTELTLETECVRDDHGARVKRIQEWLSLHQHHVRIDGRFGPATEQAVRAFQEQCGLPATGRVDTATMAALTAPLREALQPIFANGHSFPQLVAACARQHLAHHPREIGGQNAGPWVRLYTRGREGRDYPWCAGFVSTVVAEAAHAFGCAMPFTFTLSCDDLGAEARRRGTMVRESDVTRGGLPDGIGVFLSRRAPTDWTHAGLVIAVRGEVIQTIEGNTNDSGDREGFEVCCRTRGIRGKDYVRLS